MVRVTDEGKKTFVDNPHLEGTRDEFIEGNMKLAYMMSSRYFAYASKNGIDKEDLDSIAMMGLIKAYDGYDPSRFEGVTKFSTYAVPMIKGEIYRHIRDTNDGGVKVGRISKELAIAMFKSDKEYKTIEEVMADFEGVTYDTAKVALDYVSGKTNTRSIHSELFATDGEPVTLEDTLGNSYDYSTMFVREFLESLSERESQVVKLHFIEDLPQREVGRIIGVSQVQISRIIGKVRERAEAFSITGYVNRNLNPEMLNKTGEVRKQTFVKELKPKNKMEELKKKMVSTGLAKVLNLLENTLLSYNEIAAETGVGYGTIAYYGKDLRTVEQNKEIRARVKEEKLKNKKALKEEVKVTEKEIEQVVAQITDTPEFGAFVKEIEKVVPSKETKAKVVPSKSTKALASPEVKAFMKELEDSLPPEPNWEPEPEILKPEPEVVKEVKKEVSRASTNLEITAGGEDLTISEIKYEFAKTIDILMATRANGVAKFSMELKVEA